MTRNNSDFDSPHLHKVSELSSRGWQEELGADDFLTEKVWPGQLPQTFETEYTESGPPLAPIHICCKLFLLNTLVTRLLKASQLIPASAIKSMTFMDREVFFHIESGTIFTDSCSPY